MGNNGEWLVTGCKYLVGSCNWKVVGHRSQGSSLFFFKISHVFLPVFFENFLFYIPKCIV